MASAIAFLVAVTQNYQLNKRWTFHDHNPKITKKYIKYFILNFLSFLINLLVLNLVVIYYGDEKIVKIIGQILGIAAAMGINFLGSHLVVFKKFTEDDEDE